MTTMDYQLPDARVENVDLFEGLRLPLAANANIGDYFVILENDEYSVQIITYDMFVAKLDSSSKEEQAILYNRVLSYCDVEKKNFIGISSLVELSIEQSNPDLEHIKVVYQNQAGEGIKMYYSLEAYYKYIESLNAPTKLIKKED